MALHQMVNGVKVDCSAEEEAEIRAFWAANEKKKEEKNVLEKIELEEKEKKFEKLRSKLGLTFEELDLLKNI